MGERWPENRSEGRLMRNRNACEKGRKGELRERGVCGAGISPPFPPPPPVFLRASCGAEKISRRTAAARRWEASKGRDGRTALGEGATWWRGGDGRTRWEPSRLLAPLLQHPDETRTARRSGKPHWAAVRPPGRNESACRLRSRRRSWLGATVVNRGQRGIQLLVGLVRRAGMET